jgi:uncharacterized protein YraI
MRGWIRAGLIGGAVWMLAVLALTPTATVEAQAQFGSNWTAQFYNSTDLTGPVVATAAYPTGINQNWADGFPRDGANNLVTGMGNSNYSARFTTVQTLPAGNYTFILTYDDGARLKIDSTVVIDDFQGGAVRTNQALVSLTGGTYTITVEYLQIINQGVIQVSWLFGAGGTPGFIPTVGPTPTPAPIATGQVVRVRGLAVRTGPYIGASFVGVARPGTQYPLLAKNNSEGPFTWYLIQLTETRRGWASGRYLEVAGNLDAIPFQNTVFDQIDGAPDIGVIGQTRAVMNIRVRPSERTARIGQVPWGDQVSIIGRTRQGGSDFWYHIRYNGIVGWILADFVRVRSGFIDAVPVR